MKTILTKTFFNFVIMLIVVIYEYTILIPFAMANSGNLGVSFEKQFFAYLLLSILLIVLIIISIKNIHLFPNFGIGIILAYFYIVYQFI